MPSTTPQANIQSKKIEPLSETEREDWQKYVNKNFSIQFPQDAKIENLTSIFDFMNFGYVSLFLINHLPEIVDEDFYQIRFALIKGTSQNPEEIIKNYINQYAKDRETQIISSILKYNNGNIDGLYFRDLGEHINNDNAYVAAVKNSDAYVFIIRGNNNGLNDKKLMISDKILSTFTPRQPLLADKPLDQLIHFTLPEGWRLEKQDSQQARQASGALVITTEVSEEPNQFSPPRGFTVTIYKNEGGTANTRDMKYKELYDGEHDPNPGGAVNHDVEKLMVRGYPAVSSIYSFEMYRKTYQIWQGDSIWTIDIDYNPTGGHEDKIDQFISSITFSEED